MFFDLEPNNDNIFKSMMDDSIGRNISLSWVIKLIDIIDGGRTIAIDGTWGSGKTFFVKQCEMIINSFNDHCSVPEVHWDEYDDVKAVDEELFRRRIKQLFKSVEKCKLANFSIALYYDAWLHDSEGDPVSSLIFDITRNENVLATLPSDCNLRNFAADIMEMATGRDVKKLIEDLRGDKRFNDIIDELDFKKKINEYLELLPIENCNRIVVFIDELDRCNPEFAIRFLERIKHYLDHDRVTFIFSINKAQLEQTVKKYYGMEFDAGKYLNRFFDITFPLPKANMERFYSIAKLKTTDSYFEYVCKDIGAFFNMSMRDYTRYHLVAKMLDYNNANHRNINGFNYDNGLWFEYVIVIPFMIALHQMDADKYEAFVNGQNADCFLEFIEKGSNVSRYVLNAANDKNGQVKEIAKKAYEAIFNNQEGQEIEVGNMCFERDAKTNVTSLITDQMCFE